MIRTEGYEYHEEYGYTVDEWQIEVDEDLGKITVLFGDMQYLTIWDYYARPGFPIAGTLSDVLDWLIFSYPDTMISDYLQYVW